jgi:hypothetical protein
MQRTLFLSLVSASLVAIVSLFLLAVMVLPVHAVQKPIDQCTLVTELTVCCEAGVEVTKAKGAVVTPTSNPNTWGTFCLINTVHKIVNWIFNFLIVVAILLIAIAGFLWMTSGSDAQKQKTAGAMIVAALIGIVIAMLAKMLPAVILSILG